MKTEFQVLEAEALSIGATALFITPPAGAADLSGAGLVVRRAQRVRITNTHATQTLYYSKSGTPTATSNDGIILAGKSAVFPLPAAAGVKPMLLGSGAATTGVAEYGV